MNILFGLGIWFFTAFACGCFKVKMLSRLKVLGISTALLIVMFLGY